MSDPRSVPTIPTSSLAELLVDNRADAGLTIEELSRASGLGADRVAAVEAGRHDLSDVELSILLDRYPIPSATRRYTRTVVEIDLDGGSLRLRRTRRPRTVPSADRNLLQYLALVHHRHGVEPGTDIPLKAVDLGLLRASLALRRDQVTSRLDRMTGGARPGLVRNRSLLAAAVATGVVVAAGAVVLIPANSDGKTSGGAADPRIDIGVPLVVERDPSEIPAPGPIVRPAEAVPGTGVTDPGGEPGDPGDAGAAVDPGRTAGAVVGPDTGPADPQPSLDEPESAMIADPANDPSPAGPTGVVRRPDRADPAPPSTPDEPRSRGPPPPIS